MYFLGLHTYCTFSDAITNFYLFKFAFCEIKCTLPKLVRANALVLPDLSLAAQ
eukprot:m.107840 g.107840  ORF g.107840 m.107840 type:complete len:53 (-) comp15199_c1_seq6:1667-1825(-)